MYDAGPLYIATSSFSMILQCIIHEGSEKQCSGVIARDVIAFSRHFLCSLRQRDRRTYSSLIIATNKLVNRSEGSTTKHLTAATENPIGRRLDL